MKDFVVDIHTHTIVSGHAYNTLLENIREGAKKKGIKVLGTTEHGPNMPGGPHLYHFSNLKILPRIIEDVIILRGCEANIIDNEGNIDIPLEIQEGLDIIIASFHESCISPGTREENTHTLLKLMDNPMIDIIGHPGNPAFPIYEEDVVKKAKEKNVLIEINNSSLGYSRKGSASNCIKIAKLCRDYGVKIMVGSDAHTCYHVGRFNEAIQILKQIDMPEYLIMNTDEDKIIRYLKNKKKLLDI